MRIGIRGPIVLQIKFRLRLSEYIFEYPYIFSDFAIYINRISHTGYPNIWKIRIDDPRPVDLYGPWTVVNFKYANFCVIERRYPKTVFKMIRNGVSIYVGGGGWFDNTSAHKILAGQVPIFTHTITLLYTTRFKYLHRSIWERYFWF